MSTFNEATQQIADMLTEHGPDIKIGVGMISGLAAVGFGIAGSLKLSKDIKENPPKTKKEWALKIVLGLGPAIAMEIASVCLIKSGVDAIKDELDKTNDALAAAIITAASAKEASKIKEEALKKTVDEKTFNEYKQNEAQERLNSHPVGSREVTMTQQPQQLFYDPITDRYFMSTLNNVNKAFEKLNWLMRTNRCVGLNEYCWELGLKERDTYRCLGWLESVDGYFDYVPTPAFSTDGRTCTSLEGIDLPDTGYWEKARLMINR